MSVQNAVSFIVIVYTCCLVSVITAQASVLDELPCPYARNYEYSTGLADPTFKVWLVIFFAESEPLWRVLLSRT